MSLSLCVIGAPCDNYQGYCDFFQNCRGVASDGPLARLKNFLSTDKAKDWLIVGYLPSVLLFALLYEWAQH